MKRKKREIDLDKPICKMDDFELAGAEMQIWNKIFKINTKISALGFMYDASTVLMFVGVGAFIGSVTGILKVPALLAPTCGLAGFLGHELYYRKEEKIDELLNEVDSLETKYDMIENELVKRFDSYADEEQFREVFPEFSYSEVDDDFFESEENAQFEDSDGNEVILTVDEKWLM